MKDDLTESEQESAEKIAQAVNSEAARKLAEAMSLAEQGDVDGARKLLVEFSNAIEFAPRVGVADNGNMTLASHPAVINELNTSRFGEANFSIPLDGRPRHIRPRRAPCHACGEEIPDTNHGGQELEMCPNCQTIIKAGNAYDPSEKRDNHGRWTEGAAHGGIPLKRKGDKPAYTKEGKPALDMHGQHRHTGGEWIRADGKSLTDKQKSHLKMVPPTWRNVLLNPDQNHHKIASGEYRASGGDWVRQSKQTAERTKENFEKMMGSFGDVRKIMDRAGDVIGITLKDATSLKGKGEREAALSSAVMAVTGARPDTGGGTAKWMNYGATTLEARHVVKESDGSVWLRYVPGKHKGKIITVPVENAQLAQLLLKAKKDAGKDENPLFPDATYNDVIEYCHRRLDSKPKDLRKFTATRLAMEESETVMNTPMNKLDGSLKRKVKELTKDDVELDGRSLNKVKLEKSEIIKLRKLIGERVGARMHDAHWGATTALKQYIHSTVWKGVGLEL